MNLVKNNMYFFVKIRKKLFIKNYFNFSYYEKFLVNKKSLFIFFREVTLWQKKNNKNAIFYFIKNLTKTLFVRRFMAQFRKFVFKITKLTQKSIKFFFTKYFYVGLGYKMYINMKILFIWVGLTHYTLIPIPLTVKVIPKKKRIYLVSKDEFNFKRLVRAVRDVKKKDIYKSKGILEVKSYKNFIKMKKGKKKQY